MTYRSITLGQIIDEIEEMEKGTKYKRGLGILPNSNYVVLKNAVNTLIAYSNYSE